MKTLKETIKEMQECEDLVMGRVLMVDKAKGKDWGYEIQFKKETKQ